MTSSIADIFCNSRPSISIPIRPNWANPQLSERLAILKSEQTPIHYAARSEFTESDYRQWILDLKARFRSVQLKAAVTVNTELLAFYWNLNVKLWPNRLKLPGARGF